MYIDCIDNVSFGWLESLNRCDGFGVQFYVDDDVVSFYRADNGIRVRIG